jgi:hypothetical protein
MVFKLVPANMTAKENVIEEEKAFYPGREVGMDL